MSIETYQFNLPITPGSIPPVLHLSQYDSGRKFTAILRDDANVPFELDSGATAVIKGRNAAGIAWQQDCTVSGANVTFTPSGAATDQFGVMPVTIEITESEEVISPLCVVFHIQKAGYTNEEAVLSPDFETAIQAAVTQAIAEGGLGFSDEFKEALLACFNGVAWDEGVDGQALIDDLEAALYPDVHLDSITAAYDQDRPIYDTDSLDLVRLDLVVTANYSDGTTETLADDAYTLTGTLTAGTSTVTVNYGGKTATIEVTVTHNPVPASYQRVEWVGNTEKAYVWSSAYNMVLPSAFRLEAKTKLDDFNTSSTVGNILACFQPNANSYGMEFGYAKSGTLMAFAGGTSSLTPADQNAILTCGVVCDGTNVKVFIDNGGERTYGTEASASRDYTSTNYGIFYAGTSASSYNQLVGRIYYIRLYNSSDELIAEYLPCYRKSDNVIGFYETVGEVFYTNDGSGLFTKGGDI